MHNENAASTLRPVGLRKLEVKTISLVAEQADGGDVEMLWPIRMSKLFAEKYSQAIEAV